MKRKRITQIFPFLLPFRKKQRALFFRLGMYFDKNKYSKERSNAHLERRIYTHKSLLHRKLGDTDQQLQHNKVTNLKLASDSIHQILIYPNETFSFWKLVGEVSYKKGYKDGVVLMDGEAKAGVGGGLCQLGNLLFWMFLHTPLDVIERHRHSYDPFPDYGRVIPFGTGATLAEGWLDLKLKNTTNQIYQILVWFDDEYIYGEIRANEYPKYKYHVKERNHRFIQKEDGIYRYNEIYRELVNRQSGQLETSEFLFFNDSLVKYEIDPSLLEEQKEKELVGV